MSEQKIRLSGGKTKGFTLIELLVVMVIIGILATIGLGNYFNSQMKTRDAKRKHDLGQIQKALEMYYNDNQRYPDAVPGIPGGGLWQSDSGGTIYLKEVPQDPKANGMFYRYIVQGDGTGYFLYARLENENDPCFGAGGNCKTSFTEVCTADGKACNYVLTSANVQIP